MRLPLFDLVLLPLWSIALAIFYWFSLQDFIGASLICSSYWIWRRTSLSLLALSSSSGGLAGPGERCSLAWCQSNIFLIFISFYIFFQIKNCVPFCRTSWYLPSNSLLLLSYSRGAAVRPGGGVSGEDRRRLLRHQQIPAGCSQPRLPAAGASAGHEEIPAAGPRRLHQTPHGPAEVSRTPLQGLLF